MNQIDSIKYKFLERFALSCFLDINISNVKDACASNLQFDSKDKCKNINTNKCKAKILYHPMRDGKCSNKAKPSIVYCGKYSSYNHNFIESNISHTNTKCYKYAFGFNACR